MVVGRSMAYTSVQVDVWEIATMVQSASGVQQRFRLAQFLLVSASQPPELARRHIVRTRPLRIPLHVSREPDAGHQEALY